MTKRYALITACRNEEAYISATIESILRQTIKPCIWIIVNDGSIDGTEKIINKYKNNFIKTISIPDSVNRDFVSKVNALQAAYLATKDVDYDFIGNLDADVTVDRSYFELIMNRFQLDTRLGLAGGYIYERSRGKFKSRSGNSVRSVAGAVQFFRKECFDEIGGYFPLKYGGEDWYAEVMALMKGWKVQSFPDIPAFHHRATGFAFGNAFRKNFLIGKREYLIGSHPLFEIFKSFNKIKVPPYGIGAVCRVLGYFCSYFSKEKINLPNGFVQYLRTDQMKRLKAQLFNKMYDSTTENHAKTPG